MPLSLKGTVLAGVAILVAVALLQPHVFGENEGGSQNLPEADGAAPATAVSAADQAHGAAASAPAAPAEGVPAGATPPRPVEDALEQLTRRIEVDPNDVDAWMALGAMLTAAQDHARASEAFAAAVEARPDDAAAHAALGRALLYQGLLRVARQELVRAIELDATLVEAHLLLGITYSHAAPANLDAARAAWARTIELGPTSEFAKQATGYLEAYQQPAAAVPES